MADSIILCCTTICLVESHSQDVHANKGVLSVHGNFITDTNQVRSITNTFILLQSGSVFYKRAKLTGAQYKHRYVFTWWRVIIELYVRGALWSSGLIRQ